MGFQIRSLSLFPRRHLLRQKSDCHTKEMYDFFNGFRLAICNAIKNCIFNKNYLSIWQKNNPWLKWTNYPFSGSISILIGCYFCHSSDYKIMTGPTAGSKWSLLIPCPLGHNKLPFTCIQIKYTRLVRQGGKKWKMHLQNGLILKWDEVSVKVFCFSFYLIMVG